MLRMSQLRKLSRLVSHSLKLRVRSWSSRCPSGFVRDFVASSARVQPEEPISLAALGKLSVQSYQFKVRIALARLTCPSERSESKGCAWCQPPTRTPAPNSDLPSNLPSPQSRYDVVIGSFEPSLRPGKALTISASRSHCDSPGPPVLKSSPRRTITRRYEGTTTVYWPRAPLVE